MKIRMRTKKKYEKKNRFFYGKSNRGEKSEFTIGIVL